MRIVGPIQFWRVCVIYLWNNFPPKSLKQFFSKIFEIFCLQNLWNNYHPKSLKQISSKIFETIFLQNLWNNFPPKSLKLILQGLVGNWGLSAPLGGVTAKVVMNWQYCLNGQCCAVLALVLVVGGVGVGGIKRDTKPNQAARCLIAIKTTNVHRTHKSYQVG